MIGIGNLLPETVIAGLDPAIQTTPQLLAALLDARDEPGHDELKLASRLQLAFELVQETPIRAIGDDLLWTRLDHADFVQTKGVEPDRILSVVLPPFVVGDLVQRLKGIVVGRGEAAGDNPTRDARRISDAKVRGLEDGTQNALCGNGMLANELAITREHAAEILRPRTVD